ncbi:hypothetical protein VU04_12485, partial [Desulfobulbus sp. TB]|nr:hypothetical protein [Desulfobulbus sp. TB]
ISYELLSRRTIIDNELTNLKNISKEIALHIDSHLNEKTNIALTLSSAPLIKESLRASNAEFSALPEPTRNQIITNYNERWKKTEDPADPFIRAYMTNPTAEYFKKQQQLLPENYGEIFLTNAYGVMIATTGKLTTLAHAHKYWWKAGYHNGQGKIFLDDRGFDTSVQGYVLGIVVPIKEGEKIIGILKCNVNILGSLTDVIQNFSQRNRGQSKVVRTGGLIVREEGATPLSTRVPNQVASLLQSRTSNGAIITAKNKKQLTAF